MAGRTRLRESGATLVPVRGHRMASRRIPALGSALLGRPIADRPGPARRSLSIQLDPVPAAAERWLDPANVHELVLRPDPLHGGAVLLLAVPRPEAHSNGEHHRRRCVRIEWLLQRDLVAADAERRDLGSAGFLVLPAPHARRIAGVEPRSLHPRSWISLPPP